MTKGWARALLGVLLLAALLITPGPGTASAQSEPAAATQFVQLINQLRANRNLPALTVDPELTRLADEWTGVMVAEGEIFHADDLSIGVTANWQKLGENVGVGGTVPALHDAFVASPGHLANLVDPNYTRIGVAVRRDGNRIFTTHRFMALQGGQAPAPPTTKAPTTQPPTTKAPTTQPPATAPTTARPPATQAPTTEAPTTQPPTTQAPSTTRPPAAPTTTKAPVATSPTTTAVDPSTPNAQQPTTSTSAANSRINQRPAAPSTGGEPAPEVDTTGNPEAPQRSDSTPTLNDSLARTGRQSPTAAAIEASTGRTLGPLLKAIGDIGPQ